MFQQLRHPSTRIVMILLADTAYVCNLFASCYFGKLASDSYEKMANCLYEANWRDLPIGLQKYLIIMMADAQRPIYYHACGLAILNLETFTKVC